ncbi:MAG TPA: response regulator [Rhodanobacter sp.]|nr:response regulator [Rhodanobacter sp.]
MMARTLVVLVDDDDAARHSLQALLEMSGYRVDAYADGQACLDHADVGAGCLITDIRMPGMDGLALHAEIARRFPALPVIFITGHGDVSLAVRGLKAGAVDFIEKPFEAEAMLSSVVRALAISLDADRKKAEETLAQNKLALLTPRQRQVFDCLVTGQATKDMAISLALSPRTIEIHRHEVMKRLKAGSVADLTRLSFALAPHNKFD